MSHYQAGEPVAAGQLNSDVHQGIRLIGEQILETDQDQVTFSSIPGNFQTLEVSISGGMTTSSAVVAMTFNGDTGSNYTDLIYILRGDGTYETTAIRSGRSFIEAAYLSSGSLINSATLSMPGYARTDRDTLIYGHSVSGIQGGVDSEAIFNNFQGWWQSSSAITNIDFTPDASTQLAAGSIFRIFGIGDPTS